MNLTIHAVFSKVVGPVYTTILWKRITVVLCSCQHLVLIDSNICLSNEYEFSFPSGFNLHLPDHSLDRASFCMFIDHLCFLLGNCLFVL